MEDNIKHIYKKWDGGMDWIDLAQDKNRWWAVVKCGSETTGPIKCGEFLD